MGFSRRRTRKASNNLLRRSRKPLSKAANWLFVWGLYDIVDEQSSFVIFIFLTRDKLQKKAEKNDDSHVPTLLTLIMSIGHSKSTDPRDNVYAMLGVTRNPIIVIPDNRKSVVEVYMESTRGMIAERQSLGVLSAVQQSRDNNDLRLGLQIRDGFLPDTYEGAAT